MSLPANDQRGPMPPAWMEEVSRLLSVNCSGPADLLAWCNNAHDFLQGCPDRFKSMQLTPSTLDMNIHAPIANAAWEWSTKFCPIELSEKIDPHTQPLGVFPCGRVLQNLQSLADWCCGFIKSSVDLADRGSGPRSSIYPLSDLQQARDALKYAQSVQESLRPTASAATAEKRRHDAEIWLKLLESVLNPERRPPSPHHKFRGPPAIRAALEDLRDACNQILGDFEELGRDRDTAARPTLRDIAPAIEDAAKRLNAGIERYLKERPPLISCPHCYWIEEPSNTRPNRPTVCPRCLTVIRQPGQLPTDFQAAHSAADGLLRYCHVISDLARGNGSSRQLLQPPETWASTGAGMIRQLAEFLPKAQADLCPALEEIEKVAEVRSVAGVHGLSAHHAVLVYAQRIADVKDREWADVKDYLTIPPFDVQLVRTILAKECAAAERDAARLIGSDCGSKDATDAITETNRTSSPPARSIEQPLSTTATSDYRVILEIEADMLALWVYATIRAARAKNFPDDDAQPLIFVAQLSEILAKHSHLPTDVLEKLADGTLVKLAGVAGSSYYDALWNVARHLHRKTLNALRPDGEEILSSIRAELQSFLATHKPGTAMSVPLPATLTEARRIAVRTAISAFEPFNLDELESMLRCERARASNPSASPALMPRTTNEGKTIAAPTFSKDRTPVDISRSPEAEARDSCCECARLTASFIRLAQDDTSLMRVRYEQDGKPVDRALEPRDFAGHAERIWAELRRASGPMHELGDGLARCSVPVPEYPLIGETSCHAFAGELAYRVLNNARIVAGYPPIFPPAHHPRGRPSFFEYCRQYPQVFDEVASQGFDGIGTQWESVREDLRSCFPEIDSAALIGLIRKEAAQAADLVSPSVGGARPVERPAGGEAARNRVQRSGGVWHLHFEGESGGYPERGSKCLGYIATVVARPNRSFTIRELVGDPEGKLASESQFAAESETDPEGLLEMKRRLEDIESLQELGESERLVEEKTTLLESIKRAKQGMTLGQGSPLRKAHHNISTQIRKFVNKRLSKDMPKLAAHFRVALKLDFPHVGYYPPSATAGWET
jgi:hypothetical protein